MISIIIPVYNASLYLAKTLQSVQAQAFTAWEVIIVDDGSRDNSLALAENLRDQDARIFVFSQKNAGVSAARNFGLAKSDDSHPYALFLDSDDLLVPDALQTLVSLLDAQPESSAACGFVTDVDAEGHLTVSYDRLEPLTQRRGINGFRLVRREADAPLVFGDLCFHNHIITTGQVLVRKAALETVGAFDQSLIYAEDYDLWWRLTMQTGPIAVTQEPVLLYRHHGTSISGNRTAVKRGAADVHWKLLTYPRMSPGQKQTARIGYFYRCLVKWQFAAFYLRRGEIKHGLKHAALGTRDMIYYFRDLVRLRREAAVSGGSASQ